MIKVFDVSRMHNNCIVVYNNNKCVVIDIPYGAQQAENFVKDNNLQVVGILLTHGHFDHVGGVKHFVETVGCPDVPIYCNFADKFLCNNATHNKWHVRCDDCNPTCDVAEGKLVVDEFAFEVIHTPFHTAGSVVYLFEDYMFSGDTLFCGSIGRTDFDESIPQLTKQSLAKLVALPNDYTVISGHGEITTLDNEKRFNPYLKI